MKRLMVKLGLVVLAAGTLGGVAAPSVASASTKKTPTFTNTDLKRYYKNAKSKTAFYFKTYKSNGKTGTLLIFGDFNGNNANVKYGVPTSIKLNKTGKTLTTKYKLIEFKTTENKTTTSLTKKAYTFKLTKKSSTTFSTKVTGSKLNRRLATSGKSVTYSKVKKSPASAYAKKYVKPALQKKYTKIFNSSTELTAAQKKQYATQYTNNAVKTMINNFNYKS
ncbi:MAG: hypothetical protein LKH74_07370 [Levilactobacillus sp.]|uniref:hypothetical protein n=1 Tax=Levilactobacillus sp. TaxID=2767919 RepID=UPI0025837F31|nr:hypothetical protein [Levilactobacillus sp.]MCH4123637.1 hypothetical protein [Levilactobacillus sp.]MCI1553735.1 hypothetical protein [Levilactobacillus sp.]MCI1599454.1 hypothetical protein [Levilactobacillus sp.]MCI1605886.1 hypothetical protein [Levilactobacillus sp.]